ncbi:probable glutathione peroxidase 2 [Macadamia integrifolia]|uniref:probable glutathione peroxidase 2 n=1 Tax=Macadamia integrifolia TaxID=60698 RepID=UPI001C4F5570|nr:probable glutathione peroxidase 2 [Macadamia integrifolia]
MHRSTIWSSVLIFGVAYFFFFFFYRSPSDSLQNTAEEIPKSICDFTIEDIHGNDVSMSSYKGKVLMIVNVDSKCGLTHANYQELNILYEKYKNQGERTLLPLKKIFMSSTGMVDSFFLSTSLASASIVGKRNTMVEVNGKNTAPIYKLLKSQKGGIFEDSIKWNFTKFLVDKNGKVVERYAPTTSPLKIEKDIQNLLGILQVQLRHNTLSRNICMLLPKKKHVSYGSLSLSHLLFRRIL